jgi:glycosyltransferase involved in cell wall biosynthesis
MKSQGKDCPKISIITPSFNQGEFLEDTITSVLGQGYPNLEYIIIDGGSTDNSVEIIRKYEKEIKYWQSEKDDGQQKAINFGFSLATGNVFGWLNSDDMYMPGTLDFVGKFFEKISMENPAILFGNCVHLRESKNVVSGSNVRKMHDITDIELFDHIIQPSSFWTKSTFEKVGPLHEKFNYAFDWEWFIRANRIKIPFYPVDRYLSIYRVHEARKTATGGVQRLHEIADIYANFHSRQVSEAFLKNKTSRRVDRTRRILQRFWISRLVDPTRLLYNLYFRSLVSWKQFDNLRRM